jgi:hypothetical protein
MESGEASRSLKLETLESLSPEIFLSFFSFLALPILMLGSKIMDSTYSINQTPNLPTRRMELATCSLTILKVTGQVVLLVARTAGMCKRHLKNTLL